MDGRLEGIEMPEHARPPFGGEGENEHFYRNNNAEAISRIERTLHDWSSRNRYEGAPLCGPLFSDFDDKRSCENEQTASVQMDKKYDRL